MDKVTQIVQLSNGRWRVYSRSGKNLGTFSSRRAAQRRSSQFERFIFMNRKKSEMLQVRKNKFINIVKKFSAPSEEINLNKTMSTTTYSSLMRELRKNKPELLPQFMQVFKSAFDAALQESLDDLEQVALLETIHKLNLTDIS